MERQMISSYLVQREEDRYNEMIHQFNDAEDFFAAFRIFDKYLDQKVKFLVGYHHNFKKRTPVNNPTFDELMSVWSIFREWKEIIKVH